MISGLCVELLSGVLMSAVRESGPERLGRKKKRLKNNFDFFQSEHYKNLSDRPEGKPYRQSLFGAYLLALPMTVIKIYKALVMNVVFRYIYYKVIVVRLFGF